MQCICLFFLFLFGWCCFSFCFDIVSYFCSSENLSMPLGMCGFEKEKWAIYFRRIVCSISFFKRRKKSRAHGKKYTTKTCNIWTNKCLVWQPHDVSICSNARIFNSRCHLFSILTYIPCHWQFTLNWPFKFLFLSFWKF